MIHRNNKKKKNNNNNNNNQGVFLELLVAAKKTIIKPAKSNQKGKLPFWSRIWRNWKVLYWAMQAEVPGVPVVAPLFFTRKQN